jgi:hypothetical protein
MNFSFFIFPSSFFSGGGMGIRTPDIQLAKLALYQLSYTPALAAAEPLKNLLESFFSLRLRCLSLLLTAKTELCAPHRTHRPFDHDLSIFGISSHINLAHP